MYIFAYIILVRRNCIRNSRRHCFSEKICLQEKLGNVETYDHCENILLTFLTIHTKVYLTSLR